MTVPNRFADHGFEGASALVLGATGGIGSAIARELDLRGAQLTLVARTEAALEHLDLPGVRHALDLRGPQACQVAVDRARSTYGRLDLVVNAVGIVAFGPVTDLSIDAMEELFLTNTFIPIMVARAALPALEAGGAIVNMSGIIAEQNLPGMAAYGASKAAVAALDQALAREARRMDIRVIDARPPHTETGLADRAIEGTAPNLGAGIDPARVAEVVCDGIERGDTELASGAF